MKYLSSFFVCCVVVPLSLGASVYENLEIANMEQKLEMLEKNLKQMKLQKQAEPADSADLLIVDPRPSVEWSDAALFKDKNEKQASQTPDEQSISEKVLLYTNDVAATVKEITSVGGKVSMQLGEDLVIASIPYDKVKDQFQSASTHVPKSASSKTLSYVKAYWKSVEAETMEQPEVHRWTEKTAPMSFHKDPASSGRASTLQTMTGRIAVVLLIASGPGRLAVSDDERNTIVSEAIAGLRFWEGQAPASAELSFALYSGRATISAVDSDSCPSFEACHNRFAIPTLAWFGYSNVDDLEDVIIQHSGANGAYIAFFSKYRQSHFAYAYFGGGPIYMQYSNDGWGPDQIDRVFAHETGHVFNTPDEYTGCQCNVLYGRGDCTERNSNCNTCTSTQEACIMDSNQFEVCRYTRKHIGWCE